MHQNQKTTVDSMIQTEVLLLNAAVLIASVAVFLAEVAISEENTVAILTGLSICLLH